MPRLAIGLWLGVVSCAEAPATDEAAMGAAAERMVSPLLRQGVAAEVVALDVYEREGDEALGDSVDALLESAVSGDTEGLEAFAGLLTSDLPIPRAAARRSLSRAPAERESRARFFAEQLGRSEASVRLGSIAALGILGVETEANDLLLEGASDDDLETRRLCLEALGALARAGALSEAALSPLMSALTSEDAESRQLALAALGDLARSCPAVRREAVEALSESLDSNDALLRVESLAALAGLGAVASPMAPAIAERLRDGDDRVALAAGHALSRVDVERADRAAVIEALAEVLEHEPSPPLARKLAPLVVALAAQSVEGTELLARLKRADDEFVRKLLAGVGSSGDDSGSGLWGAPGSRVRGIGTIRPASGVPIDPRSGVAWLDSLTLALYPGSSAVEASGALDRGRVTGPEGTFSLEVVEPVGVELADGVIGLRVDAHEEGRLRLAGFEMSGGLPGGPFERGESWISIEDLSGAVYQSWEELLSAPPTPLSFFREVGDRAIYAQPESDDGDPLSRLEATHDLEVLAVRGDWMRVRITEPSVYCEPAEAAAGAERSEGWLRWRDEQGLRVWIAPRGC